MFNKKIFIISVLLILFFILGIGIGFSIDKKSYVQKMDVNKDANDTYQAGWAAAKQRLIDTGVIPDYSEFEIKSLHGTVENITTDKIQIKITPLEPLADPSLDIRTILITNNTVINKIIRKSDEQYTKEVSELNAKGILKGPDSPDSYIKRFYSEKTDIRDIKVGSSLKVDAAEDIREKSEIIAEMITISD